MRRTLLLTVALVLAAGIGLQSVAFAENTSGTKEVVYTLSWDVASTATTPAYRAEHYSVWISTTGNTPGNFTTMLFEETLPTTIPGWQYQPRTLNISTYAGANVYVAFRHHLSTDKDRIVIDNVKLLRTENTDLTETVFLFEDFQAGIDDPLGDEWMPTGWTKVNLDGDAFNWYFGVRQGQAAMRSQSWDGTAGALTPDNWLVTPQVHLQLAGMPGDVNGDGAVNVLDIVTTTAFIMGQNPQPFIFANADINGDGNVNILDIVGIVNIILGS